MDTEEAVVVFAKIQKSLELALEGLATKNYQKVSEQCAFSLGMCIGARAKLERRKK